MTPVPGDWLCGAVRFEIEPPTLFCPHSHCSMCPRAHGAGYVTSIGIPYERFPLVARAPRRLHLTRVRRVPVAAVLARQEPRGWLTGVRAARKSKLFPVLVAPHAGQGSMSLFPGLDMCRVP